MENLLVKLMMIIAGKWPAFQTQLLWLLWIHLTWAVRLQVSNKIVRPNFGRHEWQERGEINSLMSHTLYPVSPLQISYDQRCVISCNTTVKNNSRWYGPKCHLALSCIWFLGMILEHFLVVFVFNVCNCHCVALSAKYNARSMEQLTFSE